MKIFLKKIVLLSLLTSPAFAAEGGGGGAAADNQPDFPGHIVETAPAETWETGRELRTALSFKYEEAVADGFALDEIPDSASEYFERRFPNIEEIFANFTERGGHVHYVKAPFHPGSKENYGVAFGLKKNDLLIPICHSGVNRSQVMNLVLRDMMPLAKTLAPHGAFEGFDPRLTEGELTEENFFEYLHLRVEEYSNGSKSFYNAFSLPKQHRSGTEMYDLLGEDKMLNPPQLNYKKSTLGKVSKTRQLMSQMMTEFWINIATKRDVRRKIFVCFGQSAGAMISRLEEAIDVQLNNLAKEIPDQEEKTKFVAIQRESVYKKIHVIVLPWPDPISNASSTTNLKAAGLEDTPENRNLLTSNCYQQMYHEYSKLFYPEAP